ncbi:RNA-binding S4 domain-containing protein [Corynebacterium uberis]|uniref:RNA-binding S4 domain-containing protein n=1 Tax=Corynebacterium TaxID=1716 RepID=UPI001D09FFE9|nr:MULTISPECIES: RNA-binding S4 domain-containing protein [Corynebacterium]MCZ9309856.1 RNA-binding S4 domain-containing protein [Corynebacterium sp. c6VSa_13]UDL73217.1 RNA-binding S4 domain-containing protein [Corynebacterium uberis]UDL75906.1 RNA-binding S4 domain-containing protein [Corynebacterium uberis]UDL78118.1 RNA-binding S4 domain-containing protein [Corynebacterium uberis]UDL80401.1 RNA-binding S4 domain-containing protein [Corynebacterium uberis]
MQSFEVAIRDESIKLGQFLKLAALAATGGEAKAAIAAGEVLVDGQPCTQRGHVLRPGDVVEFSGQRATVVAEDDQDYFDEATANDDFDPEKWRNL